MKVENNYQVLIEPADKITNFTCFLEPKVWVFKNLKCAYKLGAFPGILLLLLVGSIMPSDAASFHLCTPPVWGFVESLVDMLAMWGLVCNVQNWNLRQDEREPKMGLRIKTKTSSTLKYPTFYFFTLINKVESFSPK